jgi:hypothetical protein
MQNIRDMVESCRGFESIHVLNFRISEMNEVKKKVQYTLKYTGIDYIFNILRMQCISLPYLLS